MTEEELKEACRRLDKAGIPYAPNREIWLVNPADEDKARRLLKGLLPDPEAEARYQDAKDFERAVKPLTEYMKRRKSQTHGLDRATVLATYEGTTLKVDRLWVPANQECRHDQHHDTSSSSHPDSGADPEN